MKLEKHLGIVVWCVVSPASALASAWLRAAGSLKVEAFGRSALHRQLRDM